MIQIKWRFPLKQLINRGPWPWPSASWREISVQGNDLPMIQLLDKEAKRLRVLRQSIIKAWIAGRLEKAS